MAAVSASVAAGPAEARRVSPTSLLVYGALGLVFGITITKGEVVSWFRIQEMFRFQAFHMYMFRFQAFHMYGVMAAALAVATSSL